MSKSGRDTALPCMHERRFLPGTTATVLSARKTLKVRRAARFPTVKTIVMYLQIKSAEKTANSMRYHGGHFTVLITHSEAGLSEIEAKMLKLSTKKTHKNKVHDMRFLTKAILSTGGSIYISK